MSYLLNSYSLNSNAIFWDHSAQGKYHVCATAESSGRRTLLDTFSVPQTFRLQLSRDVRDCYQLSVQMAREERNTLKAMR